MFRPNANHPMPRSRYPRTSDGRYFVAANRLWRRTDPGLDEAERRRWVSELMSARRAVRDAAGDDIDTRKARDRVQQAKQALGERGPVWWNDGAPDETGRAPAHSTYATWWANLTADERRDGGG